MQTVLIIIHLLVTIALVIAVLLQRSEGGALGIGGGLLMVPAFITFVPGIDPEDMPKTS